MFSRKRGDEIGQAQPEQAVFRGFGVMRKYLHTLDMGKYDDAALGAQASASATAANYDRVLAAVAAELQLLEEKFSQEGKEAAEALRLAGVQPNLLPLGKEIEYGWRLFSVRQFYDDPISVTIDGRWHDGRNICTLGKPAIELESHFKSHVVKISTNLDTNGRFAPDTLLPTAIMGLGVLSGEFVTYANYPTPLMTLEDSIRTGIVDLIAGR